LIIEIRLIALALTKPPDDGKRLPRSTAHANFN
jgi:hypothetical protein